MKSILKSIGSNMVAVAMLMAAAFALWQVVPTPAAEASAAVDHGLVPVSTPASFADVIEVVKPAVVNISSTAPAAARFGGPGLDPSMEEFFRRFFERQSAPAPQ